MAHKSGELKKRAQLAKQRLKMGYFESAHASASDRGGDKAVDYIASYARFTDTATNRDEKMYKKVCAILDRDEATINPIGQLIDNDVYSALDAAAKQRYILELSNKFRELKDRYYRERAKTS